MNTEINLEQLLSDKVMKYLVERLNSGDKFEKEQVILVDDFSKFTSLSNKDAFDLLKKTVEVWIGQTLHYEEIKYEHQVDQRIISTYSTNFNSLTEQGKITINLSSELLKRLRKKLKKIDTKRIKA